MTKNRPEPVDPESLADLTLDSMAGYGVAVQWTAVSGEFFVTCGNRINAEKYLREKVLPRKPHAAEVVRREIVRVLGPWESVDERAGA